MIGACCLRCSEHVVSQCSEHVVSGVLSILSHSVLSMLSQCSEHDCVLGE